MAETFYNPNTGRNETRKTSTAEDQTNAATASKTGSTANAGLGSFATRAKKRKPMPMLFEYNGDKAAHSEAIRKWRQELDEQPETQGQKKALGEMK